MYTPMQGTIYFPDFEPMSSTLSIHREPSPMYTIPSNKPYQRPTRQILGELLISDSPIKEKVGNLYQEIKFITDNVTWILFNVVIITDISWKASSIIKKSNLKQTKENQ